ELAGDEEPVPVRSRKPAAAEHPSVGGQAAGVEGAGDGGQPGAREERGVPGAHLKVGAEKVLRQAGTADDREVDFGGEQERGEHETTTAGGALRPRRPDERRGAAC